MRVERFGPGHPANASRLRRLRALLGANVGEQERQEEELALKSRDRNGCRIDKPHGLEGTEAEPRRDASGRRLRDSQGRVLDKPGDPARQKGRS